MKIFTGAHTAAARSRGCPRCRLLLVVIVMAEFTEDEREERIEEISEELDNHYYCCSPGECACGYIGEDSMSEHQAKYLLPIVDARMKRLIETVQEQIARIQELTAERDTIEGEHTSLANEAMAYVMSRDAARAEATRLTEGLNLILDGAAGCYGNENMPSSIGDVLVEVYRLIDRPIPDWPVTETGQGSNWPKRHTPYCPLSAPILKRGTPKDFDSVEWPDQCTCEAEGADHD